MATQTRISVTKAILDSMKNIKMMGLVDKMQTKIQATRDHEIAMMTGFNWLIVAFSGTGELICPVCVLELPPSSVIDSALIRTLT